jgi:hypothetical protein
LLDETEKEKQAILAIVGDTGYDGVNKVTWQQAIDGKLHNIPTALMPDAVALITTLGLPTSYVYGMPPGALKLLIAADQFLTKKDVLNAEIMLTAFEKAQPTGYKLVRSAIFRKHLAAINAALAATLNDPNYQQMDATMSFKGTSTLASAKLLSTTGEDTRQIFLEGMI